MIFFLFFGSGRGFGGRATIKADGNRPPVKPILSYNKSDENGEQDFYVLFPVFGCAMARQKSKLSMV